MSKKCYIYNCVIYLHVYLSNIHYEMREDIESDIYDDKTLQR